MQLYFSKLFFDTQLLTCRMFLLVPDNHLSAFKCKQKLKAKTERNTKKSGYHPILIKINILCEQKCELFENVLWI